MIKEKNDSKDNSQITDLKDENVNKNKENSLSSHNTNSSYSEKNFINNSAKSINQINALFVTHKDTKFQKTGKSFKCNHKGCTKNSLTKKQIINHHDKIDIDCTKEKKLLYNLLIELNLTSSLLFKSYYLYNDKAKNNSENNYLKENKKSCHNNSIYKFILKLQSQYKVAYKASLDHEKFKAIIKDFKCEY